MEVNIGKLIMSLTDDEVNTLLEELLVRAVTQLTKEARENRFEITDLGA